MEYFTVQQAARLVGLSPRRLRHWEKIGFISRTIRTGKESFYSFQDLVSLKAAAELITGGISLQQVTRSLEFIRKKFPEIENLSQLKFFARKDILLMRYNGHSFHPLTGQMLMSFEEEQTHAPASFPRTQKKERSQLYWFEYGLRYDIEGRWELAVKAYRKALRMDPTLVDCWNNLATIYYRVGRRKKAVRFYRNALKISPSYKLAYYNLGNIYEEVKKFKLAVDMYLKAIELDPQYFDAHYNLALVYDKTHSFAEACHHWGIYLKYDSTSRWARYAQDRLRDITRVLVTKNS